MRLQFLGAARTVTGSCHLVRVNGHTILLDCGLFQGRRKEAFERNRNFPVDPSSIHAVVLSHSHIDHSGNLPRLAAAGFDGPIWATRAAGDLCGWMLRDSAHIQERDVEYVNKKRKRRGQRPFEPLYTVRDAEKAIRQFRGVEYDASVQVAPGVNLTFQDAGHILGSASCHLTIREGDVERKLVFTGDVGRRERPILRDPVPIQNADVLICESTYGDRLHEPEPDVREHLGRIVRETWKRGGKLLIPAFAVGRTQHLVYHLNHLCQTGALAPVEIFVDSPLATNVTQVYRDHPECYDEETAAFINGRCGGDDPFGFGRLRYIESVDESKALNYRKEPCVIISASGMCEAGRVIHHLKHIAPNPKNTILLVGFMAQHTLGRRIAEKQKFIKLFGEDYPLKARIESISGLSGHADRDELLEFLASLRSPPARTFLVHGEEEQAEAFAKHLSDRGFPHVVVPAPGQAFDFDPRGAL